MYSSLAHSFVRRLFNLFSHLSVRPFIPHSFLFSFLRSFLPSFIQPTSNSPNKLLLTDQHSLAVSNVTYELTGYFLLHLRYLFADTLHNILHPSSYILVESKASEHLANFKKFYVGGRFRTTSNFRKFKMAKVESSRTYQKLLT